MHAYLDLDDMLACDDLSFQLNLIHLLLERFGVWNYERRIGMIDLETKEWPRVHPIAIEAEAQHLRSVIGDPTIRFFWEQQNPNGTLVIVFRSREGYQVFHVFRRAGQEVQGGEVWVQTRDGRRLTVDQLRAERRAAAAPPPATP